MDKRKRYFIMQKLFGVATLLFAVLCLVLVPEGGFEAAFMLVPIGIACVFSKEKCLTIGDDFEN